MITGWEWDETLFAGAAEHYLRGRVPYAPGFAATLGEILSGRVLDVGCGPGNVTLALAPYFPEVVGLDPDPGMLAEARREAARREVANVRWVRARAEDLPAGLGEFQAVVFASSFHWMDQERVAATVLTMLPPSGAFVHISDQKDAPMPTSVPYAAIAELVRRFLGPVRRAGQGRILSGETPGGEELVIERAGFGGLERHIVPAGQVLERGEDDVVAWTFSQSGSAPHLFGERLGEFEGELRGLLRAAGGRFTEHVPPTDIRIWRRP
ncbi:class I SAM-dependent methyltransferase [Actinoplanes sp. GCM10030250]|uniref:class I SAM-dependent methyltransferase n=1 Tax=Actinoplanes sp. GCM10030250 TaxID=3273376 RepID=UPI003615A544